MVKFDEFGPEKILEVYDEKTGMHGFTVIDNTLLGPGKGGIRMTPSVSIDEVAKLARVMTYKNALAGLPFGGGKSGIISNPRELTKDQKVEIVKAFAKAIKPICPSRYIAAPDINMDEPDMRVFANANGSMKSTTGKPANMCVKPGIKCGIPHEYGSTGFGVYHATLVAIEHLSWKNIKDLTVAIEGFGNVGTFAAKYLSKKGFKFVATSDSKGLIYNKKGLDYNKLMKVKKEKRTVTKYKPGVVMKGQKIIELNVDILITAAIPNIVNDKNYKKVKAKLIVEGSNIPMTPQVENKLHKKGILIIPDFVANAGGVISSYAEYKGHNPRDMFKLVEKKIVRNTRIVLKEANKKKHCKLRDVAMEIAISRLKRKRK